MASELGSRKILKGIRHILINTKIYLVSHLSFGSCCVRLLVRSFVQKPPLLFFFLHRVARSPGMKEKVLARFINNISRSTG